MTNNWEECLAILLDNPIKIYTALIARYKEHIEKRPQQKERYEKKIKRLEELIEQEEKKNDKH